MFVLARPLPVAFFLTLHGDESESAPARVNEAANPLTENQLSGNLAGMKATLDLPDDLRARLS